VLVLSNTISPAVFDLSAQDRLTEWRRFREKLENSDTPLEDVAQFWSKAPFVSSYLNPTEPKQWPDPWHLVMDNKLDDLAIVLGMLYTLKLTQRFMNNHFEIHMSTSKNLKEKNYFLVVENQVLNLEYKSVRPINELANLDTSKIWSSDISL
jgi:hypothetical protein